MKFSSRVGPVLFLLFMFCYGFPTSSSLVSNKFLTFTFVISVQQIPRAVGFPFDYLFRKLRNEPAAVQTTTTPRPLRYYQLATDFFDWAFNELDSDETETNLSSGRFDVDKMESSEEEEEMPKLKTLAEKVAFLRNDRLGMVVSEKKIKSSIPVMKANTKPKMDSIEYDDVIEKASMSELENMLTQLKAQDEGILSPIFSNTLTTSIYSFGTNMFKTVYCGWSPKNNYCISDHSSLQDSFQFKRRNIRSLVQN